MLDEQRQNLEEIRFNKKRRLDILLAQESKYGSSTAPHILIEIADLRDDIRRIDESLGDTTPSIDYSVGPEISPTAVPELPKVVAKPATVTEPPAPQPIAKPEPIKVQIEAIPYSQPPRRNNLWLLVSVVAALILGVLLWNSSTLEGLPVSPTPALTAVAEGTPGAEQTPTAAATVDPATLPTVDPATLPTVDPATLPTVDPATLPTAVPPPPSDDDDDDD
jgi:hypothetical protein